MRAAAASPLAAALAPYASGPGELTAEASGFLGGLLTGLFNVNMWGFTGGLVGFPSFVNPAGIDGSFTASVSIMGSDPKVRAGAVDVVR